VSGFGAPKRMASGERLNKEIAQMRALVSGESEVRKDSISGLSRFFILKNYRKELRIAKYRGQVPHQELT